MDLRFGLKMGRFLKRVSRTDVSYSAGAEKRYGVRRFDVDWQVRIRRQNGDVIVAPVLNVSASGLLFQSPLRQEVGEFVDVQLLTGGACLRCVVKVVRVQRLFRGPYVCGGAFTAFGGNGRQALYEALRQLRETEWGSQASC